MEFTRAASLATGVPLRTDFRRFRVLLVTPTYPPVLGGSEIEAQRVSAALIRRGHQVEVMCMDEARMPKQPRWVDDAGVPVRIVGAGFAERWQPRVFAAAVAWTLLRESSRFDLVYFLMQGLHLASGIPVLRILRKPFVMKFSGSALIPEMQQSWLGRLELDWLRRWAKFVPVLNEGMIEEARAAGFSLSRLVWMPNPTDVGLFAPASENERCTLRESFGLTGLTVFYSGRLAPEKELSALLGGFAKACAGNPDATLVLAGDGPCAAELSDLAGRLLPPGRIRLLGRIGLNDIRAWLQAADVFALVSSREGFSCALAEAMSSGLPSVVSDIPGNRQLIEDGIHGALCRAGDEDSIAAALARLFDPSVRARTGREARRRIVENFSTDQVADRYENLFARACAGAGEH